MKQVNNNISPLPFYDDISLQNHRKAYAFGQIYPLAIYKNILLPFQFCTSSGNSISEAHLYDAEGRQVADILQELNENGLTIKSYTGFTLIKYPGTSSVNSIKLEGPYYIRLGLDTGKYLYSDIFTVVNRVDDYVLLEYRNSYNFELNGGEVDFSDDFKFRVYIPAQIGKPQYDFEEEATERMGYAFIESQVSKKLYKFTFLAPEYLCDALRIVRLCNEKQITYKKQVYELSTFTITPEWEEQGDLAAVECEFETDTVITNIGGHMITNQDPSEPEVEPKDCELYNVKDFGAKGDGLSDDGEAIQSAIEQAYYNQRKVYIPAGVYLVTRAIFVFDGTYIQGDGINNTIIRTPWTKNNEAKAYVERDKRGYNTATDAISVPKLDYANGHNRFHVGDGSIGYYDADRDTNPGHPLYYPDDGSAAWKKWKSDRDKIISRGIWVGRTGREGYAKGIFLCSQNPTLFYTADRTSPDYLPAHPQGRIFTGVRNVTICDLQINTNSIDRSKDSAINFEYKSSDIPASIREEYDSSVLNIYLKGLYLYRLGGSGIRMTRAVDTYIVNCYIRQCAEYGIRMDGVTSIHITNTYCNSCCEGGYVLRGCNYSVLTATAADSCSIGYNIYNCNGLSLVSCGAEATRYQKAEETEDEDLYKGRAFVIRNCRGISLLSCYAMTSHPRVYGDNILDVTNEELDENWLKSRHVFVSESIDIQVAHCAFKSYGRIRSTPYRDADGNKVSYTGGVYDPATPGSRYWQVQNYLVGAQFEIRGEESSVQIISAESKGSLTRTSEIRWGNLDILDLGRVACPVAGFSTAGKTLSGDDGNGGWTYIDQDTGTTKQVTFDNFEFIFPINATKSYGERNKFWEWRNSLCLVRRIDDTSLQEAYPNKYRGYRSVYTDGPLDWSAIAGTTEFSSFVIDIVKDYNKTSFIDGSKSFFEFGKFAWQQLDTPVAYDPMLHTAIPAFVRDKPEGTRIAINTNDISGFPNLVNRASVSIIGNKQVAATETTEAQTAGPCFAIMSRQSALELKDSEAPLMLVCNIKGSNFFSVFPNSLRLGVGERRVVSGDSADYAVIPRLSTTADMAAVVDKLNQIIDRLTAHGFAEEPNNEITFGDITIVSVTDTAFNISFIINADVPVYDVGVAYSTTNPNPDKSNNYVEATAEANNTYTAIIPRSATNPSRYIRPYLNTEEGGGASTRLYGASTRLYGAS